MIIQNNEQWANYIGIYPENTGHILLRASSEGLEEIDAFPSYPAFVISHSQDTYLTFHYIFEVEDAEALLKIAKQGIKRFE